MALALVAVASTSAPTRRVVRRVGGRIDTPLSRRAVLTAVLGDRRRSQLRRRSSRILLTGGFVTSVAGIPIRATNAAAHCSGGIAIGAGCCC